MSRVINEKERFIYTSMVDNLTRVRHRIPINGHTLECDTRVDAGRYWLYDTPIAMLDDNGTLLVVDIDTMPMSYHTNLTDHRINALTRLAAFNKRKVSVVSAEELEHAFKTRNSPDT